MDIKTSLDEDLSTQPPPPLFDAPAKDFLLYSFERLMSALNAEHELRQRERGSAGDAPSSQEDRGTFAQILDLNDDYPFASWDK
jgi:hypothetical protein